MTKQKIGLISGTFDPIHRGHIALAEHAKNELELDEVWLLPEKSPRRKSGVTKYDDRMVMCELAVRENDWLKVKVVNQSAHNLETIRELQNISNAKFYLLIGGDVAAYFDLWEHASEIKQLVTVLSFSRNNVEGDIHFDHPASSRSIREKIDKTHLPDRVIDYIHAHKLYQG